MEYRIVSDYFENKIGIEKEVNISESYFRQSPVRKHSSLHNTNIKGRDRTFTISEELLRSNFKNDKFARAVLEKAVL